jgi:ubiquinone/menaquinone biosynthesis C-methylase UbiE
LLDEYELAEKFIRQYSIKNLKIADLAAGTGWTCALISKLSEVDLVHAVEISQHRIEELFEKTVRILEGNPAKIKRYLGSFYEIKLENSSVDIDVLSQAFHHSDEPLLLLKKVSRILKKGGSALLIGEHYIDWKKILRRIISILLKERRLSVNFYDLFPA